MEPGDKSNFGVPCAQLQFWNGLLNELKEHMAQFVHGISETQTYPPENLSIEQWKLLLVIYNNVFHWIAESSTERNDSSSCYNVPLEMLTVSSTFSSNMCRHHRVQEFLLLNTGTASLDYCLSGETIPDRIHPLLYQCLAWLQWNLHCCPLQVIRTFDVFLIPDGSADSIDSIPEYSTESQVLLKPSLMKCYDFSISAHRAQHQMLQMARAKHIVCKFCFPSELGMCAHALDRGYEVSLRNRPNGMKHVPLPNGITDSEFKSRHERLHSFLLSKAKLHCSSNVDAHDHDHKQCVHHAYRRYIYSIWNRIVNVAQERYLEQTNVALLLPQFEKHLFRASKTIAETFQMDDRENTQLV